MSTNSPRLYDVKRGFRRPLMHDAAIAVYNVFGQGTGGMNYRKPFKNSAKSSDWRKAKSAFEIMVGYTVSNHRFYTMIYNAKKAGLMD